MDRWSYPNPHCLWCAKGYVYVPLQECYVPDPIDEYTEARKGQKTIIDVSDIVYLGEDSSCPDDQIMDIVLNKCLANCPVGQVAVGKDCTVEERKCATQSPTEERTLLESKVKIVGNSYDECIQNRFGMFLNFSDLNTATHEQLRFYAQEFGYDLAKELGWKPFTFYTTELYSLCVSTPKLYIE